MTRRFALALLAGLSFQLSTFSSASADRPNILWISSEDHGPHMGCYGDKFATTPNVDALAARGASFDRCQTLAADVVTAFEAIQREVAPRA